MSKLLLKVWQFLTAGTYYKSKWVEDLPDMPQKNTIYIIGGRKYPFYAAITCPRKKCRKIIHLQIDTEASKRWRVKEHENGALSLSPSIHIIDSPCGCHYWIKEGRTVWCEIPSLCVPRENQVL